MESVLITFRYSLSYRNYISFRGARRAGNDGPRAISGNLDARMEVNV